jgi:hypothetical protein
VNSYEIIVVPLYAVPAKVPVVARYSSTIWSVTSPDGLDPVDLADTLAGSENVLPRFVFAVHIGEVDPQSGSDLCQPAGQVVGRSRVLRRKRAHQSGPARRNDQPRARHQKHRRDDHRCP